MIEMGEVKFGDFILKNPVSTERTIYGLAMIVTNPLYDNTHQLKNFFEIEGAEIYTEQPIVIMNRNAVSVNDFLKIYSGMSHLAESMGLTEDDDLEATIIDNINRTIRYARYIDGSNTTIFDIIKDGGSKFINMKDREDALANTLENLAIIAKYHEIKIEESKKRSKFKIPIQGYHGEDLSTAPKVDIGYEPKP